MTATQDSIHYRKQIQNMTLLFEVSQLLDKSMDLTEVITPVLQTISDSTNYKTIVLTLIDENTGQISIESSLGLSEDVTKDVVYRLGEGITGKVVQSGEAMVIPHINEETDYLDKLDQRSGKTEDRSFICVPIKQGSKILGALGAGRLFTSEAELDEDLRILTILASLIARAAELRKKASEEKRRLTQENNRLHRELKEKYRPDNMIGNSQNMQEVYSLINQVSKSDATVLIRGESGTGKELVASAIHYNSLRADKPFVRVNCAALPESVIESELFGHEKGSFTGAVSTRKGRFEMADGGTIFLDEIGELSHMTQVKLLRVLQEREIERVGSMNTIKINVRVITATNRNLEEEIKNGSFREDLYYRLNVFPIHIPPLRQRKTDIMLLADYFAEKYGKKNGKNIKRITSTSIDLFQSYHWPGNVRELENVIERAALLSTDEVIHAYHLPPSLQSAESTDTSLHSTLQEAVDSLEKELIKDALKTARGNRASAARALGISERIIGLRVDKYGIDCSKYKNR
ncbi:sigma-54 interaction domain-containing protein [Spirochaeta isovalerica]|uniref:Nif-specific regulatory protein n=1 Tax=Spirochaeta isovalerica TaxID=150 RepID=A0A841R901_9SPIO|nr:sigma 54-interacting transcriptional regulator [Spirochaeta isovalerica]MBB6480385.1 Nif-specific regulatory protein [Spirochaeta isovalerica]